MKNKLAIFDLDGTLFNTNDVNFKAYQKALNEYGYNLDYEYFCEFCNGRHYKQFLGNIVDDKNIIDLVHKNKKKYYSEFLEFAKINTHLFEIAEALKSTYHLAVVTTASKLNTYDILDHFDKTTLFDLILTHDDIEKVKPDPEGFIKAIDHFNIDEKNVIIFEDSKPGIEAAMKTNASVFVINRF